MLDSVLNIENVNMGQIGLCTGISIVCGVLIAFVYMFRNPYTKNFIVTIALLPTMIQAVIMLVNGNLGTGVAVMGAFGLVRFRSVPGTSREIICIFFAMAVGLATGTGYIWYALMFTILVGLLMMLYSVVLERESTVRNLRITLPDDVDYTDLFDDIFQEFTKKADLERTRTTNLGTLYELQYTVILKNEKKEKEMLDKIRVRNGNLNITCGKPAQNNTEL